jgi:hypothetical protein
MEDNKTKLAKLYLRGFLDYKSIVNIASKNNVSRSSLKRAIKNEALVIKQEILDNKEKDYYEKANEITKLFYDKLLYKVPYYKIL